MRFQSGKSSCWWRIGKYKALNTMAESQFSLTRRSYRYAILTGVDAAFIRVQLDIRKLKTLLKVMFNHADMPWTLNGYQLERVFAEAPFRAQHFTLSNTERDIFRHKYHVQEMPLLDVHDTRVPLVGDVQSIVVVPLQDYQVACNRIDLPAYELKFLRIPLRRLTTILKSNQQAIEKIMRG